MTKDRSQVACNLVKGNDFPQGTRLRCGYLWEAAQCACGGGALPVEEVTVCLGVGAVTHCLLKNQEILGRPALEDLRRVRKDVARALTFTQDAGSAAVTCKLPSRELRHQACMADRPRVQCEEQGGVWRAPGY